MIRLCEWLRRRAELLAQLRQCGQERLLAEIALANTVALQLLDGRHG